MKFSLRPDPPQWPKLVGTAAASSFLTLFLARNFFPAEKKVRHEIKSDYAIGDDVFVRTMGHLLGPPLVITADQVDELAARCGRAIRRVLP